MSESEEKPIHHTPVSLIAKIVREQTSASEEVAKATAIMILEAFEESGFDFVAVAAAGQEIASLVPVRG